MEAQARRATLAHARVYLIVGPGGRHEPLDIVRSAIAAGVRLMQLRAKLGSDADTLALARACVRECGAAGALLIVNDRADIARASGADGVHVGPTDLPVEEVRAIVGADALVGASARDADEAGRLVRAGADHIGCGSVYPTGSKADAVVGGLAVVRAVRAAIGPDVPLFGIGGIDASNARAVVDAGADGVAVISAVAGRPDVERAARELLDAVAR